MPFLTWIGYFLTLNSKLSICGLQVQFEFADRNEMMRKAWCSIEEVPYCFSRSSVKFQGHAGQKRPFFLNWAFADCKSSLNSLIALKWCTKHRRGALLFFKVIRQISRSRGTKDAILFLIRAFAAEVFGAIRKESSKIGISVEKTYNNLPVIHATIKMHKNPVKFRFIIGSRTGVIKPVAKQKCKSWN